MSEMSQIARDKLIADFKAVVSDTEELLRATAGLAGDKVGELRAKAQDRLAGAKVKLAEMEAAAIDKAREAGRAADNYVHDNPWRSVAIAAGCGFIVGLLIGRR